MDLSPISLFSIASMYYSSCIVAFLTSRLSLFKNSYLSSHGKLNINSRQIAFTKFKPINFLINLTVSKNLFYQFYLVSILTNVLLLAAKISQVSSNFLKIENAFVYFIYALTITFSEKSNHRETSKFPIDWLLPSGISNGLVFCLFFLHSVRRFSEHLVFMKSDQRMHVLHYLVGISFYMITPIALQLEKSTNKNSFFIEFSALMIFIYSSFSQYRCHRILSEMKLSMNGSSTYRLPREGIFDFVDSPHYFYEILIYFSFYILKRDSLSLLILVFVSVNLMFSALDTSAFYRKNFKEYRGYRKTLVPFIL